MHDDHETNTTSAHDIEQVGAWLQLDAKPGDQETGRDSFRQVFGCYRSILVARQDRRR